MKNEELFAYGIGALILLAMLCWAWPYLIGLLAMVGAYQLYRCWHQQDTAV